MTIYILRWLHHTGCWIQLGPVWLREELARNRVLRAITWFWRKNVVFGSSDAKPGFGFRLPILLENWKKHLPGNRWKLKWKPGFGFLWMRLNKSSGPRNPPSGFWKKKEDFWKTTAVVFVLCCCANVRVSGLWLVCCFVVFLLCCCANARVSVAVAELGLLWPWPWLGLLCCGRGPGICGVCWVCCGRRVCWVVAVATVSRLWTAAAALNGSVLSPTFAYWIFLGFLGFFLGFFGFYFYLLSA